jgi:signal recognition particle receptor subunit beta
MPVFDPIRRCLIVRVVYDGPAFGGKTTNLRQLMSIFPVERRTEMYTPGSLKGRTMFFDWLELEAGKVGGHQVRCQLLTVPGQGERSYRRRPLLESADGVVFVADTTPDAVAATKKSFSQLRAQLRKRLPLRVPVLVQANKQDASDSMRPPELVRLLRLDEAISVVGATAAQGDGVRETVVAALRAVIRDVQSRISADGIGSFVGQPESADDLFDTLLALEDEPPPLMELDEDDEEAPRAQADVLVDLAADRAVEAAAEEAETEAEGVPDAEPADPEPVADAEPATEASAVPDAQPADLEPAQDVEPATDASAVPDAEPIDAVEPMGHAPPVEQVEPAPEGEPEGHAAEPEHIEEVRVVEVHSVEALGAFEPVEEVRPGRSRQREDPTLPLPPARLAPVVIEELGAARAGERADGEAPELDDPPELAEPDEPTPVLAVEEDALTNPLPLAPAAPSSPSAPAPPGRRYRG